MMKLMKPFLLATAPFALLLGSAEAADWATCEQMFYEADTNRDGTVGGSEVAALSFYIGASHSGDNTELTITLERFLEDCTRFL